MAADLEGWLAPNRIYPGVADAVRSLMASHEVDIVTTKQARFTHAILRQMAGIEFPLARIYSQTVSGRPKSEVLEALQAQNPGAECNFVEDKLSTLEKARGGRAHDVLVCGRAPAWRAGRLQPQPGADAAPAVPLRRWPSCRTWSTGICTWWTGATTPPRSGRGRRATRASASSTPQRLLRWRGPPGRKGARCV
jgi:hypothetical protein